MSAIPEQSRQGFAALMAAILRDGAWFDADRARGYARLLGAVLALSTLAYVATSKGGVDLSGKALGTDFASFYAASALALSGEAARVYDLAAHGAAQTAIFGRDIGYAAFFYPPIFLLMCLPFGLFPYLVSLVLWQGATALFYWRVARRFAGSRLGALPFFAFPAVMLNVGHGQNAFLSTGLFGAGILWLHSRPALAGMMFGALAYKPHLGLVIPLVLLIGRRWTAIASAGATVIGLSALSALVFGVESWRGFLAVAPLASATLEHDLVGAEKMQSAYAAIRVLGGGSGLAYLIQGIVAAGTLGALAWVQITRQRRTKGAQIDETPLMVLACLLTSPFLLDYDLMLMALPMAWLFREAMRTGFLPYEKTVLLAAFILPLLARPLAMAAHIPLGPIVILALFSIMARRILLEPDGRLNPA